MNFKKMHGLGNDFVILDQRNGREVLQPIFIKQTCDRHFGVGCDQLIIMEPSENADLFMRIYNADGSEAQSCGNATRCVAHHYMIEQGSEICTIETVGGVLNCRLVGDHMVEVDMGRAKDVHDLDLDGNPVNVNMGNPHCVFFVEDALAVDIETLGPRFEHDPAFPNRTNVEFVQVIAPDHLRMRVWERGAGVTLACGSGACAVMAAARHRALSDPKITLDLDGGPMTMQQTADGRIFMIGPVAYVFDGTLKTV